ncbi:MAG TPA: glucuronate isomerase [Gemmatimonadaceae bacterium]|nr:glucuronate isomerase [Gemmatimonadaceae bacterium]
MTEFHEDRYLDPDPTTRGHAREIFEETRALPIVSPHGHVDARMLASNDAFADPASLIVTPDHYILRLLYSRGVSLESLGIKRVDGANSKVESDPRKIWQTFAEHWHLFRGTPTRAWLEYELREVFGVKLQLNGETAAQVYDAIAERLQSPEFRPRALLKRFNIEFLATTDGASDSLEQHKTLGEAKLETRIVPTFRPDALFAIGAAGWGDELKKFAQVVGVEIRTYADFTTAIKARRSEFKAAGAKATDHAVVTPHMERMVDADVEKMFARAVEGKANRHDQSRFEAHMLMEMAAQSTDDGLVMQLHAGALRNHNEQLYKRYGADRGGDIPVVTEFTRNLRHLLNGYGNEPRFRLIVFTLDESAYSRELAPLAGHYPALLLGAPWWFHDSIEGMMRFRRATTETAGIENTAGFTDDTRAFCSIPARHDLARRVDANYLAGLVARHVIDMTDAREMARLMAYELAKRAYRLNEETKAQ